MFVSRSRYEYELGLIGSVAKQREAMYQDQLKLLQDHIADLRKLVFTPASSLPTPEMREVDQVLTPINDSPIFENNPEQDEIVREQNRIFAGEYDQANE